MNQLREEVTTAWLQCPSCGEDAIKSNDRGFAAGDSATCECGAELVVDIDDDHAYVDIVDVDENNNAHDALRGMK